MSYCCIVHATTKQLLADGWKKVPWSELGEDDKELENKTVVWKMKIMLLLFCWELFAPILLIDDPRSSHQFSNIQQLTGSKVSHYHAKWCLAARLSPWLGRLWKKQLSARHARDLSRLLIVSGDVEMNPGPVECPICQKSFTQKKNMLSHKRRVHEKTTSHQCIQCPFNTAYDYNLKRHIKDVHETEPKPKAPKEDVEKVVGQVVRGLVDKVVKSEKLPGDTALNGRLRVIKIDGFGVDPLMNLTKAKPQIRNAIEDELERKTGVKLQLVMTVTFQKPLEPSIVETKFHRSNQMPIYRGTEYKIEDAFPRLLQNVNKFQKEGSGWTIQSIDQLDIFLTKLQPLRGSSFVELPPYLKNKMALINVRNTDEKCFLWSILALLHPAPSNPNRVGHYRSFENTLNMDGINFPVEKRDYDRFERLNPNLALNVYEYEDEIYPLRISQCANRQNLHLLLYSGHYIAIPDLNRLLNDQTKNHLRKFFCPRCLCHKTTEKLLEDHLELCKDSEPTKIKMPKDTQLKFSNYDRMLRQPLTIYGDFECLVTRLDGDNQRGKTTRIQHHQPCSYGLVKAHSCCGEADFSEPEIYCGEDAVEHFLGKVIEISEQHQEEMNDPAPLQNSTVQTDPNCHICNKPLIDESVQDHCHICGRFRGLTHNSCNLSYRVRRDVVVIFHNLRKYDGHLIMQSLGTMAERYGYKVDVIARAMEDYISFSLVKPGSKAEGPGYKIKFIDSVQFLNNSLDGLVKNLDASQLKATKANFPDLEKFELIKRKGVYPYDFMDSWEKFDVPLPQKSQFYNQLNDEGISEADYLHAQKVYSKFKMTCMRDYHDLYLKTDVLLLADVFEEFRRFTLATYGLDACHYMTTPGLAWDACLKMTGVELELLSDEDMYLFCEQGIRGGICQISHRYAEANNIYLGDKYDPNKPIYFIIYWDANNLYGWAMTQRLPVSGFQWMTKEELDWVKRNWAKIDVDGDDGYIVQVDLDYPEELHDLHDQYPLAPEVMEIDTFSPYCQGLRDKMEIKLPPQTKLVPNLKPKQKYILHMSNLQYYLKKGLSISAIHRGIKFRQHAWLEPYIMFNTRMRAAAKNAFEKDLFKLLNNAVFGKTMENVKKHKNVELVTNDERFEKLVKNPRFKNCCRFNDNLVGVCMLRPSTCLNKPIYCGLTVLDLSKLLMYRWHYDYIIPKYNLGEKRAQLLFTDTDSLCYYIRTDDIYKDMQKDSDRFDFSDYPETSSLYSTKNKKVIGKMKDELSGVPMEAFCGLRPKMYAMLPEKKRAKGIKKRVVEKKITFDDYKKVLFGETSTSHEMTIIRSDRHEIYTETILKKSLCAYDDKRWLLDETTSRAIGHKLN